MGELYRRRAVLRVGEVRTESFVENGVQRGLDFSFNVVRTLKSQPNTCDVIVRNLSPSHRAEISQLRRVPVRIEAGYDSGMELIFQGDLRDVRTYRDGADIVTEISGDDGGRAVRSARAPASFGKAAKADDVIRTLGEAIVADVKASVSIGNVREFAQRLSVEGIGGAFSGGVSFGGSSWENFQTAVASVGGEASIQNGAIQVMRRRRPAVDTQAVISPNAGLVGAPGRSPKGIITGTLLMVPGIFPGAQVRWDSEFIKGLARVEAATYTGDTRSETWNIDIETREI